MGSTSKKNLVMACGSSQRDCFAPWIDVFGIGADEEEQIDGIDDNVGNLYTLSHLQPTHPTELFGTQVKEIAWKPGDESTTPRRPVAVLQQVQNPPRCQRVEDLGSALEDWLSKKRQFDKFTGRDGRPCQASGDSLVAAMFRLMPKNLEETVMFTNEDEGFQESFDRLLAYSSTKQSR